MRFSFAYHWAWAICLLGTPLFASAQSIPAFPGAEGAGAIATGGRPRPVSQWITEPHGTVYHVTNLDPDPDGDIPGSLRYGLDDENFYIATSPTGRYNPDIPSSFNILPRIIVFDVGGTIDLSGLDDTVRDIDITPRNFTLAGQTAPGGITIYGGEFNPGHRDDWDTNGTPATVNNLVIRNISVRTHDANEKDGLWMATSDSIADHVSLAWYTDEGLSITDSARNVSIQHSIIGPGWKNPDGDGSQLEGKTSHADISVHHNLYIHNDARIPRLGEKEGDGVEVDFRNNVIFNWNDSKAGYGHDSEPAFTNFVNNYYIGGPGNSSGDYLFYAGGPGQHIFQSGNLLDLNKNGVLDGTDYGWARFDGNESQESTPYSVPHGVTQSPSEALATVQDYVGANWQNRDFLDGRVLDQLATFGQGTVSETGQVLSNIDPNDVDAVVDAPMQTRPAGWDTDNDGMPDYWELQHGLNPNSTEEDSDWDLDYDADGYVNLEEYINEIAEWPAPFDIQWTGGDSRFEEILNWSITRDSFGEAATTTNWQPSKYDVAVIDSGTVTVDSVGQHAGTIRIGSNPGDVAALSVTAGWLKVENTGIASGTGELIIGGDPGATAALSLSGGELSVETLSKGTSGSFSFTGGKLHADEVAFDLVNDGGTIAPGASPGQTHVSGNLTINSGALEIEIASDVDFDTILVDNTATLDGQLNVRLIDAFVPESSDVFEILTADSRLGTFANAASLVSFNGGTFDVTYTTTSVLLSNFQAVAGLLGDYNFDGVVDAADYTVWRDSLGETGSGLAADGNDNNEIDAGDYDIWKAQFGATSGSGTAGAATVPEPASILLIAIGLAALAWRGRPAPRG